MAWYIGGRAVTPLYGFRLPGAGLMSEPRDFPLERLSNRDGMRAGSFRHSVHVRSDQSGSSAAWLLRVKVWQERDAQHASGPGHPPGLYFLFATEMWERFGFYTAAAIMTLYLQRGGFGWTKDEATSLWSNYLMFVYATPLL